VSELWRTALCGVIGIGTGSCLLAVAELYIRSGSAALFHTTAPFWMVGIDAFLPHGKRPLGATLAGLLIDAQREGIAAVAIPRRFFRNWRTCLLLSAVLAGSLHAQVTCERLTEVKLDRAQIVSAVVIGAADLPAMPGRTVHVP